MGDGCHHHLSKAVNPQGAAALLLDSAWFSPEPSQDLHPFRCRCGGQSFSPLSPHSHCFLASLQLGHHSLEVQSPKLSLQLPHRADGHPSLPPSSKGWVTSGFMVSSSHPSCWSCLFVSSLATSPCHCWLALDPFSSSDIST